MANNIYIGNRYVPIFANPVEWDNLRSYEPLTIVTYQGTSYTSRKTVPVGVALNNTEYWVATGNYNYQVQELINDVEALNNDMQSLEDRVFHKKIIFIGDSYQWGGGLSGSGNKWNIGWLGVCTTALGLTENVDFWHDEYPGRGFTTSTSYLNMLQSINIGNESPNNITDIIVTGGLNDTVGVNSLSTAIQTFISYCKTTYPNAKVHIGYIGNYWNNPQLRFDGRNVSVYYELFANKFGACYINNSQYLLHDSNYFSTDETWHPNQSGHNVIAYKMVNYILDGVMNAIYGYHSITFDSTTSDFDSVEGTPSFSTIINNNISTIKSQNLIRFRSTNGISINSSSEILLGTISACGINPAISGYSEVPVNVTFNNYVSGNFEYETWPCKIVYKNDNAGNRNLYLVTNAPNTITCYSAWLSSFDMIMDTNLT